MEILFVIALIGVFFYSCWIMLFSKNPDLRKRAKSDLRSVGLFAAMVGAGVAIMTVWDLL
jgi:hypothetical protein